MTDRSRMPRALLFTAAIVAVWSSSVYAIENTRYVSVTGNNVNACTLAAPCRTLQRGFDATPEGGELRILDSGFYGTIAIVDKSMTIAGNGNTVQLGNHLSIDDADAVVTLRGLVLNGRDTVSNGIIIIKSARVHIEDCVVHGFTQDRIVVAQGSGAETFVTGSTARDNGNIGLLVLGATSIARISNSTFTGNGIGIFGEAVVESRGNNTVRGNRTNVLGTLTPIGGL